MQYARFAVSDAESWEALCSAGDLQILTRFRSLPGEPHVTTRACRHRFGDLAQMVDEQRHQGVQRPVLQRQDGERVAPDVQIDRQCL
jgi:hypothetical protein